MAPYVSKGYQGSHRHVIFDFEFVESRCSNSESRHPVCHSRQLLASSHRTAPEARNGIERYKKARVTISIGISPILMAPTAVAVSETPVLPSNGKAVKDEGKVFNPFYSPSIGDDGDDSYEHAQFKVSRP